MSRKTSADDGAGAGDASSSSSSSGPTVSSSSSPQPPFPDHPDLSPQVFASRYSHNDVDPLLPENNRPRPHRGRIARTTLCVLAALWSGLKGGFRTNRRAIVSTGLAFAIVLAWSNLDRPFAALRGGRLGVGGSGRTTTTNAVAERESLGFYNDVSRREWRAKKSHTQKIRKPQRSADRRTDESPADWYGSHWDVDFDCGDGLTALPGGKTVCDPKRIAERASRRRREQESSRRNDDEEEEERRRRRRWSFLGFGSKRKDRKRRGEGGGCLVYTTGRPNGFAFETALNDALGRYTPFSDDDGGGGGRGRRPCEVHAFEPTIDPASIPGGIAFHRWGFRRDDDDEVGGGGGRRPPAVDADGRPIELKTLRETLSLLGHAGRFVDVFMIDCDGCEWDVYRDWFDSGVTMGQIIAEVHGAPAPDVANDFFRTMQRENYVAFHKEIRRLDDDDGKEVVVDYGFLKMSPEYFD